MYMTKEECSILSLFVEMVQHERDLPGFPSERWRSGHGNRVGANISVEAQVVKAENTISVGHCVIPLGKGLVPHCSVVRMRL